MIVGLCHRISERDIERVARLGCESVEALHEETCVATGCGTCHACALDTFECARDSHTLAWQGVSSAPRALADANA